MVVGVVLLVFACAGPTGFVDDSYTSEFDSRADHETSAAEANKANDERFGKIETMWADDETYEADVGTELALTDTMLTIHRPSCVATSDARPKRFDKSNGPVRTVL